MPELPEVETVKNGIALFIGNARILSVEITNRKFRITIPENTEKNIVGAKIEKYQRIGKYVVISLDNDFCIVWHLGMSGKIKTLKEPPLHLEKHDHIVIKTENGWLVYNDPRRFGLFTTIKKKDINKSEIFKNTGIDPFDNNLTGELFFEKIKNKKTPIKITLLDQSVVCGIGNIYAPEILYESRISPFRESNKIDKKECDILVKNIRTILQKAIDNGGSTLRDYQKPDGSLGYFQNMHCVYNKTGQKCPDCTCNIELTGGIKKAVQAGRSTFYCETLQK